MIKRVAKAIKAEVGRQMNAVPIHPDPKIDDWSATGGTIDLEAVARAAIAAMREPTVAMRDAGMIWADARTATQASEAIAEAWREMIDVAMETAGQTSVSD